MDVAEAARRLAGGEAIAFPTETVYGLGADATNPEAVAKIFALKGRPAEHPLIVHIGGAASIGEWAREVPPAALALAQRFWPGPLTMILKKSPRVPASVTGGQDSVGLRCPSHRLAQELLREFARIGSGAIAAPSANKFGHVSPTTAARLGLSVSSGALVTGVAPGSPAEQIGIGQNAVITAVNGTQIASSADLGPAIQNHKPGDRIQVTWVDQTGTHNGNATLIGGPAA